MFDARVSTGWWVRPWLKVLWLVLNPILFHKSSDRSLFLFQSVLFSGCESIVAIFKRSLIRSESRISMRNFLFKPFAQVIHLKSVIGHPVLGLPVLRVRFLLPHNFSLSCRTVSQSQMIVPFPSKCKGYIILGTVDRAFNLKVISGTSPSPLVEFNSRLLLWVLEVPQGGSPLDVYVG
jgi:hypothetical protein